MTRTIAPPPAKTPALSQSVSDLVAEGGNTLASDDTTTAAVDIPVGSATATGSRPLVPPDVLAPNDAHQQPEPSPPISDPALPRQNGPEEIHDKRRGAFIPIRIGNGRSFMQRRPGGRGR